MTDRTDLYEVLIRFPKGGGSPSGAHVQWARTITTDDGEIVKDYEPGAWIDGKWVANSVYPLALVRGESDRKTLIDVLGEVATASLNRCGAFEIELALAKARIDQLERLLQQ